MIESDRGEAFLFDPGDQGAGAIETPIFDGPFTAACKAVWALPEAQRARAYIRADGWTYTPDELESMKGEDEGEI